MMQSKFECQNGLIDKYQMKVYFNCFYIEHQSLLLKVEQMI